MIKSNIQTIEEEVTPEMEANWALLEQGLAEEGLLGLPNRAYFEDEMAEEGEMAELSEYSD